MEKRQRRSFLTREWFMTRLTLGEGCWEWQGARRGPTKQAPVGYGIIRRGGKAAAAHRVAYELFTGAIPPEGWCVLHKCDNPPCCRPDHLVLGTQTQNMQDKAAKGRARSGARPKKLTTEQVVEIRRLVAAGESRRSVARRFLVSQPLVSNIVRGFIWRNAY